MVSTSWSGRRWSSPATRQRRALARGLEGRFPLQHHYVSDQNSSSSRCWDYFSLALKHGIYRDRRNQASMPTRSGATSSSLQCRSAKIVITRLPRSYRAILCKPRQIPASQIRWFKRSSTISPLALSSDLRCHRNLTRRASGGGRGLRGKHEAPPLTLRPLRGPSRRF